jgi:hypothetical protein
MQSNLAQLAEAWKGCEGRPFMDHAVAYEGGKNVLEWWEPPADDVYLAASVQEDAVRRFADALGASAVRLGA